MIKSVILIATVLLWSACARFSPSKTSPTKPVPKPSSQAATADDPPYGGLRVLSGSATVSGTHVSGKISTPSRSLLLKGNYVRAQVSITN